MKITWAFYPPVSAWALRLGCRDGAAECWRFYCWHWWLFYSTPATMTGGWQLALVLAYVLFESVIGGTHSGMLLWQELAG